MYQPSDVLILLPTLGRPDSLIRSVESLEENTEGSWRCAVIFDGEPFRIISKDERIMIAQTPERLGYWKALNYGLRCSMRPLIVYAANDLVFHEGWLKAALNCYENKFNKWGGLLTFQDDLHNGFHACHGMISRVYLSVLYGDGQFCPDYQQSFGDAELTQFSRDLGRFAYCPAAHVEHLHYNKDKREKDEVDEVGYLSRGDDDDTYRARYKSWLKRGREAAEKRMTS